MPRRAGHEAAWAACASACRSPSSTFIVGWLAIAGVPPFAGFWSKDDDPRLRAWHKSPALWAVGVVTAVLTAYYMSRQVVLVFFGKARWDEPPGPTATAAPADGRRAVGGAADSRGAATAARGTATARPARVAVDHDRPAGRPGRRRRVRRAAQPAASAASTSSTSWLAAGRRPPSIAADRHVATGTQVGARPSVDRRWRSSASVVGLPRVAAHAPITGARARRPRARLVLRRGRVAAFMGGPGRDAGRRRRLVRPATSSTAPSTASAGWSASGGRQPAQAADRLRAQLRPRHRRSARSCSSLYVARPGGRLIVPPMRLPDPHRRSSSCPLVGAAGRRAHARRAGRSWSGCVGIVVSAVDRRARPSTCSSTSRPARRRLPVRQPAHLDHRLRHLAGTSASTASRCSSSC